MEITDEIVKEDTKIGFDEHKVLHEIKHYLPAQAPLKDFVHHNSLHAFQHLKFHDALHDASEIFGYKLFLSLSEFRNLYETRKISAASLKRVLIDWKGIEHWEEWEEKLIFKEYDTNIHIRIGLLRANWKKQYHIDLDSLVHPTLFRILCSYLDQGISMWSFPSSPRGFLHSIIEIEKNSYASIFKTKRAKHLLLETPHKLEDLLKIVVGDESLYKQYLFDQQFAHQGWSGMVSTIEDDPNSLLDKRKISLHDVIIFELLLEIDAMDNEYGTKWTPLSAKLHHRPIDLFADIPDTELHEVLSMWQEALEWSFYDQVLAGIKIEKGKPRDLAIKSFQALFCIDDREGSLRRYIEIYDPLCETFSTPGFFGVEFFYQPDKGKFYTKLCPAPVTPKYLVKEHQSTHKRKKDLYFSKETHSLLRGWLISQTLGFWSAIKLFVNIFRPTITPATASSFRHMDKNAKLTIENTSPDHTENGLQIGFTIDEMTTRVEAVLKSIGLVSNFSPIVYIVGHGSSSVNNPHYSAYDCGACCGRPGSVNARVFSAMANHKVVREKLAERGIVIPEFTHFLGALHDTTRDEIEYFDEHTLTKSQLHLHKNNIKVFEQALDSNAKERSRRFDSIDTSMEEKKIHDLIRIRSVSLFQPRPELNHATNAVCIVARRSLTKDLFLDRRAFMNSFDYQIDPDGDYLLNILKAAAPVCGGINLEYYFSRVDNQKLGAGTKLPHNVMGLIGVANGIDGDLRPGLPSQMIEVHDPIRMLFIVEHYPEVVLKTIQRNAATYEWFINEWVHLIAVHPDSHEFYYFKNGQFAPYNLLNQKVAYTSDITPVIESNSDNIPVYLLA